MSPDSIPMLLIKAMDVAGLEHTKRHLSRTRKRAYLFALNGTPFPTTRRWALDAVKAELAGRKQP